MQKKWYIAYTKPKCEKKVVALLTKRNIENFCPLNGKDVEYSRKSKLNYEPLFKCYVFAHVLESELAIVKKEENVLSILYWKGFPAVVINEDIEAIREFVFHHVNIKVVKNRLNSEEKVSDTSSYKMDRNILTIKNRSFNKYLPSLGFTLIADVDTESKSDGELLFTTKDFKLQS